MTVHVLGRVVVTGVVLSVAARAWHPGGFWPGDEPDRVAGGPAAEAGAPEGSGADGSASGSSSDRTDGSASGSGSSSAGSEAPAPTPSGPGESGWPTPATTGVRDPEALTPWTGNCTLDTPGQVIEDRAFDCGIEITAPGVTIRNSLIRPRGDFGISVSVEEGEPAVIEDVTVQADECKPTGVAVGRTNYRARRVEVVGFGGGFDFAGDNTVVEDSYVKVCAAGTSQYSSLAIGGFSAHDATAERPNRLAHNTIDQRCGRWQPDDMDVLEDMDLPPPQQRGSGNQADQACDLSAPVLLWLDSGDGLEVLGNLLRGGAMTIDIESGDGHTVVGNVVERDAYAYNPVYDCVGATTWSDNWEADVSEDGMVTDRTRLDCARAPQGP